MDDVRSVLRSRDASAVALCEAARRLLGDYLAWEPESIWVELARRDVDVPAEARDRLMASITLRLVPSFYWDAIVFEKTAVALGGRPAHVQILEEASPAVMAWAAVEAAWIRERHGDEVLSFEHEPTAYVAVVLDRAGFVMAPAQLSFAQATLDRRLPKSDLREAVRRRWDAIDKTSLRDMEIQETAEDVQIARLAAVEYHVRARRAAAEAELARLA